MRRFWKTTAIIIAVLVGIVAVLAYTPVGLRLASSYLVGVVERGTGLEIEYGSLSGELASGLVLRDASMRVSGGPTVVQVDSLGVSYDAMELALRRRLRARVGLEGAEVLFERRGEAFVGWERFAGDRADAAVDTSSRGDGLGLDVEFTLRDVNATYRDTASGIDAEVRDLDLQGTLRDGSFDGALGCLVDVTSSRLSGPVGGSLDLAVRGRGGRVELSDLSLVTTPLSVSASGTLDVSMPDAPPSLDATIVSSLELERLTELLGSSAGDVPRAAGTLEISAGIAGTTDSLFYRAEVTGRTIDVGETRLLGLSADVSGTDDRVVLESLAAGAFGGRIEVGGELNLGPSGDEVVSEAAVRYAGHLELRGLSVSDLAALAPRREGVGPTEVGGTLSLSADVEGEGASALGVSGSFSASIEGLRVGDRELGEVDLAGRADSGVFLVSASCCSTSLEAEASFDAGGLAWARADVGLADLSAIGSVFRVEGLSGRGVVTLDARRSDSLLVVSADAELPEVSYGDIEAGPLNASAHGAGDSWEGWFGAFDASLVGNVSLEGGKYRALLAADALDLVAVVPDSLREALDLAGVVSARFTAEGDTGGVRMTQGKVSALDVSARGEQLTLVSPFQFSATPDSVVIGRAALATSFGDLNLAGRVGGVGEGRVSAEFTDIDLAVIERVAEIRGPARLKGAMNGVLELQGRLSDPTFVLSLTASDVSYSGVGFETITVEAENDSTDLVFYLDAQSGTSGNVMISASVPVRSDSLFLMGLDRDREFGVSVTASDLVLDVERWGVRGLAGLRRLELDGAALATGRVDSLSQARGRGSFQTLSADLGLVGVSLRDTLDFDLAGGRVEFGEATIDVVRRRVLDERQGGTVRFSGVLRRDRTMNMNVSVDSLSVGHLVRAFGDRPSSPVTGWLDLDASVEGSVTEPDVYASWQLRDPVIAGLSMDGLAGGVHLREHVLELERTRLTAGASEISVVGSVSLPQPDREDAPAELDISVLADRFRLEGLRPTRPDIKSLGGGLDIDIRIHGPTSGPRIEGTAGITDGSFRGLGLREPIEGIELDVAAQGEAVSLDRALIPMGDGSVEASGFVGLDSSGPPAFRLRVRLDDPEFGVQDLFEARLSGSLRWTGTAARSQLQGDVAIDKLDVVYEVSFAELLTRRASRIAVSLPEERGSEVQFDVDVDLSESANIESNVANLALNGGFHLGGTSLEPRFTGSVYAEEGGTLQYLDHSFEIETLNVAYIDPGRTYPHVDLVATTRAVDRGDQEYDITLRFTGFADEAVPELTSTPPLTQPDIVALLTFGDTVGMLVSGQQPAGSSGDSFQDIARRSFLTNAFGIAEASLERWLNLDTVRFEEDAVAAGEFAEADVTIGKEIGGRLSVNYTTQVGSFQDQAVEVLFDLTRRVSIGSRADPGGNHAINLRLRVPFE